MIGWMALRLVGAGIPERIARAVAIGILVVLVAAAIAVAIASRDRRLIDAHDATQDAAAAKAQIEREHTADVGDLAARQVDQQQAEKLKGAIDNAVSANPEAARAGVGPATSSALDELRRRQAAKRQQ